MATDLEIYESGNGGELVLKADDLRLQLGFSNQIYLALFGTATDFWAAETLPFLPDFFQTLQTTVLNTAGLGIVEDAAKAQLKFMEDFSTIEVNCSMPAIGRLIIAVTVTEPSGAAEKITYLWDGQRIETYESITI